MHHHARRVLGPRRPELIGEPEPAADVELAAIDPRDDLADRVHPQPAILQLREHHPQVPVVLVSKDINLRIKASIYGVPAEDYENDRALDAFNLLYTGHVELPPDFWDRHAEVRSWSEKGRTMYEVKLRQDED